MALARANKQPGFRLRYMLGLEAARMRMCRSFFGQKISLFPLLQKARLVLQYSSKSDGVSPSGKAAGFGLAIPRFES